MTKQEALREARYKHNATVEEWGDYAGAMEEQGVADFERIYCRRCGHSELDYSTPRPRLYCKRLNGYVSEYDTCKYGIMDPKEIQQLKNLFENSSSNNDK